MSEDETTTEMLAETEAQATEYTPPEGWRLLAVGEVLRAGDMTVRSDGYCYSTERVGYYVGANQRYIRRIDEQPEPQPQPVQVREGRWRTRGGDIRNVTPTPDGDDRAMKYPWYDAERDRTWLSNGHYYSNGESKRDLVEYLGPIDPEPETTTEQLAEIEGQADYALPEGCRNDGGWSSVNGIEPEPKPEPWPEPQPEPQPPMLQDADQMIRLLSEANHNHVAMIGRLQARINDLETINAATTAAFDRANKANDTNVETIGKMQRELQQQHRELQKREVRIFDLDTINTAQEKALDAANKENTDLQHRLNVVSAEWAEQAGTCNALRAQLDRRDAQIRDLQIELDALQQAPQAETAAAVSTSTEDRFEEGWDAGTARAVETIAEWLEPIRLVDNPNLANETVQHLPHIMRTLTGLTPED